MRPALERGWWLARRRLGLSGLLAIALLLMALLMALLLVRSQQRTVELQAALAQERSADAVRRKPAARVSSDPSADLVAALPPLKQSSEDLQRVFEAAARHRVNLPRGDYQLKFDASGTLGTLTATFPVQHEYGAIKRFAADVLTQLPHASLDELRMSRDEAGATVLDSMIRLSFSYRGS